jgi:radical SAM protein with 4Fe4S-binding SPASM domain
MKVLNRKELSFYQSKEFCDSFNNNLFYSPKFIKFKLTSLCNNRCIKCNYWRDYRIKRDINIEPWKLREVKSIVDQLADLGTEKIKFSGGEVTLLKDLIDILKYTKSKGIRTSITSNGLLIDKKMADELILSEISNITISLDSHIPEQHDYMVGVKGAWNKTTNALTNLSMAKKRYKSDVKITMACVVYKDNINSLVGIVDLANSLAVDQINFLGLVDAHLENKAMKVKKGEIDFFNKNIKNLVTKRALKYNIKIANNYFWGNDKENNKLDDDYDFSIYDKIPCFVPWVHFDIDYRGYLFPCCFTKQMENAMGNVREEKIIDIINKPLYKKFRAETKPSIKRSQCRRCMIEINKNKEIFRLIKGKIDTY